MNMAFKNLFYQSLKLTSQIISVRIISIAVGFIGMLLIAQLGQLDLAAGALVTPLSSTIIVIGMSPLLAISVLGSRYQGEGKFIELGSLFRQAILISCLIGLICSVIFWHLSSLLTRLHQPAQLIPYVNQYFHGLAWGIIPTFIIASCHQLFFPLKKGNWVIGWALLTLILTLIVGSSLIYGWWGLPRLAMAGWAYGISIVNWIICIALLTFLYVHDAFAHLQLFNISKKINWPHLLLFFKTSFPISIQFSSELFAISMLNIMVGWIGTDALSLQQILTQCSLVALMIPMGSSQACTIQIGIALGSKKIETIRSIFLINLSIVSIFMMLIALLYLGLPSKIIELYLTHHVFSDPLYHLGTILLGILAMSQLIDAIRNLTIGALRGLQDIWVPMGLNLIALWVIGIPCCYLLAFPLHQGIIGLNIGFLIAFSFGMILMVLRFKKKMKVYTLR